MPSKSEKQKKFMAIAAHDPKFAKEAGISQEVAKEFNNADKKQKKKTTEAEEIRGLIDIVNESPRLEDFYSTKEGDDVIASSRELISSDDKIVGTSGFSRTEFWIKYNPIQQMYYAQDTKDGDILGIVPGDVNGDDFTVSLAQVQTKYKRKGILKSIYTAIIRNDNKTLHSDTNQTPEAKAFWQNLMLDNNLSISVIKDGIDIGKADSTDDSYWGDSIAHRGITFIAEALGENADVALLENYRNSWLELNGFYWGRQTNCGGYASRLDQD